MIAFDFKDALSFEGETGPYCQYAVVRIRGIRRKGAEAETANVDVTMATAATLLTGAIVVALANINVGVFGSDQAWTDKLLASAKATGEKMWQLPMDDEYREFIKGSFADIQNIGSGKGGGSITGAWFIREFAGDTPWIHLDIAGTAWNDDAKPWLAKGPTAVALRTLVHLIQSF